MGVLMLFAVANFFADDPQMRAASIDLVSWVIRAFFVVAIIFAIHSRTRVDLLIRDVLDHPSIEKLMSRWFGGKAQQITDGIEDAVIDGSKALDEANRFFSDRIIRFHLPKDPILLKAYLSSLHREFFDSEIDEDDPKPKFPTAE